MAKQTINIGTTANDGTGDAIRAAFGKVNDNFTEIYTANTGVNTGDQNLSAYATTAAVAAGYQPLDSDLTAISALTTTAYGRALLSTADAATLRSAIGVGTTDAPTFLAQTLTGQSLTGTQATSLVDLSATWNTTGNPSLIYGRVTNTNSGTTANLIDLGTFAGGSLFKVTKDGNVVSPNVDNVGYWTSGSAIHCGMIGQGLSILKFRVLAVDRLTLTDTNCYFANASTFGFSDTILAKDATGILAQRNGLNAQAFRVYNTYTDASNYQRLSFGFASGVAQILSSGAGTSGHAALTLGTGTGTWQFTTAGNFIALADNTYDIGASGANRPRNIYVGGTVEGVGGFIAASRLGLTASAGNAIVTTYNSSPLLIGYNSGTELVKVASATSWMFTSTVLVQFGGTTDAFPAIARDGAGIKFTGAAAGSTSWIKVPAVAVSALPSAATAGVGARSFVNDALAPTFGSAVTGGGAVTVPVYSTGSAWNVG